MTAGLRSALLAAALVFACSTPKVSTEHDPSASFMALTKYAWIEGTREINVPLRQGGERLDQIIRGAVDDQLAENGFVPAGAGEPDFQVTYHAAVDGERKMNSTMRDRGGSNVAVPITYSKGSLILDIVDPNTQEVLWRGSAQAEVDRHMSGDQRQERIRDVVRRMLADFPPG